MSYSDIIYSRKILEKMKKKIIQLIYQSIKIGLNSGKKRMKINEIYNDAENLEISKKN